jgi:hypothetical protein
MNYQETIDRIKALFEVVPNQATSPAPLADKKMADQAGNPSMGEMPEYILQDGSKIVVDKLAVGGKVTLNGNPAPDGSHQLQDGTIIQTKDGMIEEITTPAEEIGDQSVNSNMEKKMDQVVSKMSAYDDKFSAYESRFAKAEETISNQQSAIGQLLGIVEKLAAVPVSNPVAPASNQFTNQKAVEKEERFEAILNAINTIKK